ncbi:hypothetical protein [Eoetvoesiella caeni]|uniref:Uncharacterized protein n=1 Tax=Eoetvoesiella caeni TaxID=645616 RepID=A0A366HAQ7_9BURK|nr:hypothetical protein [Eoetvoesiella caeni]MCI2809546.1 hypothetical protein [Eoetvoesiella caeni]NYT56042.1 hypothetical protein [Eoetvoesiella caeni]RBP38806.1 hypothetical protein DFR37_10698 [Eoetvoesiella caeni]
MKTATTAVTALPTRPAKRTPAEEIARLQARALEHDQSAHALFESILEALAKHGNTSHHVKALAIAGRDLFDNWAYEASEEADK